MSRTLHVHASPALLRHLAREELVQSPALTFIPNLAAGRSLRQLTRQALPTITFSQHARRSLSRAGWRPLDPAQREMRLMALLERLELEYFGQILHRPGTVSALTGVIRALLRADASRLPPGRSARERDLVRLHRAWVLELLREQEYESGVPEFFASRTALVPERLVVMGFAYLDAAQLAYLDRLAADGSALYLPVADGPVLSEARRTLDSLVESGWTLNVLDPVPHGQEGRLRRTGDLAARQLLSPLPGSEVASVYVLPSVLEEVREVLRQVKRAHHEEGRPWHELVVVVRDEASYLAPLTEVASEYGVPLLSQARLPFTATPLGSLLVAWAEAGLREWPFDLTRRVLTHPLLRLNVDPGLRLRRFGRASPRGLQAWDLGADALAFEWPASARGLDYLQHLTATLTLAGVLAQQREQKTLGVALAVLAQALRPLEALPEVPLTEFLGALLAALNGATVPLIPGKGGVRVTTPLGTLGRSFQAAWVLGLAEGVFPRPASDPPLLDAHLRAHWSQTGVYLPGGAEAQAIEQALFFHALACARERLTLTRPETLPSGKPAAPSPFLRPFGQGQTPREPHAASEHESRVLRARLGLLDDDLIVAASLLEDRRERATDPGPVLPGRVDPDTWIWSASQLHTYGACRYHWFASKVMNLRAMPEPVAELDPLSQGTLYHLVLERLLQPVLGHPSPSPDDLTQRIPDLLDEAVSDLMKRGEIDPGPLWHVERKEHVQALQRAVRSPEFLPGGTQVRAVEQRLDGQLPVGEAQWTFRGFADRVDVTAAGHLAVVDYKLNKYVSKVRGPGGHLSLELQLPVYLSLLQGSSGRYFSLNGAKTLDGAGPGWFSGKYDWPSHDRQVKTFLQSVRQETLNGDFRALPDPATTACTYCDMKPVCRVRSFRPRWKG